MGRTLENKQQIVEELKGLDGRIKDVKDQQRLFEGVGNGETSRKADGAAGHEG